MQLDVLNSDFSIEQALMEVHSRNCAEHAGAACFSWWKSVSKLQKTPYLLAVLKHTSLHHIEIWWHFRCGDWILSY